MEKLLILTSFLFHISTSYSAAQTKTLTPLQQFVQKWSSIESVSFEEMGNEKSMFSDDTISSKKSYSIFFDTDGNIESQKMIYEGKDYKRQSIFTNKTHFFLETDSTYTWQSEDQPGGTFAELFSNGLIKKLKIALQDSPQKIHILADTTINNVDCYRYQYNDLDSTSNNEGEFMTYVITFDKRHLTPVNATLKGFSRLEAGGVSIGSFSLYNQSVYTHFKHDIGSNYLADFILPEEYRPHDRKSAQLLNTGDMAPEWSTLTLSGDSIGSQSLRGSQVLLFLTHTQCPANQLSNAVINKLVERFPDLKIVGLYGNTSTSLSRYLERNPLHFKVAADAQPIKNKFNAPGSPFFYLIDKDGRISFRRMGYSTDLMDLLTSEIQKTNQP